VDVAAMSETTYTTASGKVLLVCAGLGGDTFAAYERKPNGALKRLVSPALPVRKTRDEAQRDFEAWVIDRWRRGTKAEKIDIHPIFLRIFGG
jgi:hypothetical protein